MGLTNKRRKELSITSYRPSVAATAVWSLRMGRNPEGLVMGASLVHVKTPSWKATATSKCSQWKHLTFLWIVLDFGIDCAKECQ
jgi:hypothetical protein